MEGFIDLILELKKLRDFGFQWYGLREIDYSKKCSCVSKSEGISSPTKCTRCFRTGYMFTDFLVKGYIWHRTFGVEFTSTFGKLSTQQKSLILEHNRPLQKFSFVLELDQEIETGKLVQPFSIMRAFEVQDVTPLKGDEGRIEFWHCLIEERNFDDGRPGEIGTGLLYKGNMGIPDII